MKTAIYRPVLGLLVAMSLLAEMGCAQRPPQPATADSNAMAEALSGGRRTIGVVALGPTQMMSDNWTDFDPAVRSWLAQGPIFSELESTAARAEWGANRGASWLNEGIGRCYGLVCPFALPLLSLLPVAALVGAATAADAEAEVVNVLPAMPVEVVNASLLEGMLDKRRIARAICARLERDAPAKTAHVVRTVSYEQARNRASMTEPVDALLTVRAAEVGLIGWLGGQPRVGLRMSVWTRFNRTTFRRFEYRSDNMRPVSDWTAADGRLFRQELDRAVASLTAQILDGLSVRKPAEIGE